MRRANAGSNRPRPGDCYRRRQGRAADSTWGPAHRFELRCGERMPAAAVKTPLYQPAGGRGPATILVVDDEPYVLRALSYALRREATRCARQAMVPMVCVSCAR